MFSFGYEKSSLISWIRDPSTKFLSKLQCVQPEFVRIITKQNYYGQSKIFAVIKHEMYWRNFVLR